MPDVTYDFSNLNKVEVDPWKQGNRNDCYWNIAKNQLKQKGNNVTNAQILELSNTLQTMNTTKNKGWENRGDLLYDSEQVLLTLEQAMDEVETAVYEADEHRKAAKDNLNSATTALDAANLNVDAKKRAYEDAQSALNEASGQTDENGNSIDTSDLEQAKNIAQGAYLDALNTQKEALDKANNAKDDVENSDREYEALKAKLDEMKQKYSKESELASFANDEDLTALNGQIEALENSKIELDTDGLSALMEAAKKAQNTDNAPDNFKIVDGKWVIENDPVNNGSETESENEVAPVTKGHIYNENLMTALCANGNKTVSEVIDDLRGNKEYEYLKFKDFEVATNTDLKEKCAKLSTEEQRISVMDSVLSLLQKKAQTDELFDKINVGDSLLEVIYGEDLETLYDGYILYDKFKNYTSGNEDVVSDYYDNALVRLQNIQNDRYNYLAQNAQSVDEADRKQYIDVLKEYDTFIENFSKINDIWVKDNTPYTNKEELRSEIETFIELKQNRAGRPGVVNGLDYEFILTILQDINTSF